MKRGLEVENPGLTEPFGSLFDCAPTTVEVNAIRSSEEIYLRGPYN